MGTKKPNTKTETKFYLKKLDRIIEEKHLIEKQKLLLLTQKLFKIVIEFVQRKKLLVYGGYAVNSILPKNKRFYNGYEIPDIDFFSTNARKDAIELADLIYSKGYNFTEVKLGIHYETYKIYVNFTPIVDITSIPNSLYNTMLKMSEMEKRTIMYYAPDCKINIVPLAFLRLSMHLELSRPRGFIDRWIKVYTRMTLLYDYYPIPLMSNCEGFLKEKLIRVNYIKAQLYKIVDNLDLIIIGMDAIKVYLNKGGLNIPEDSIIHFKMTLFDIISSKYDHDTKQIITDLKVHLKEGERIIFRTYPNLNKGELLPYHNIIYYIYTDNDQEKIRPLIGVYQSNACYAYKRLNKHKIATIDTILSFMYAWLLIQRSYLNHEKLKCILSWLLHIQYKYLESRKSEFHLFERKCQGKQLQIEEMKEQLWNKGVDKIVYRPSQKKNIR